MRPTLAEGTRVPPTATLDACEQCIMWTRSYYAAAVPLCPPVGARITRRSLFGPLTAWPTHSLTAECKHSLGGVNSSRPHTTPHLWPPTDLCAWCSHGSRASTFRSRWPLRRSSSTLAQLRCRGCRGRRWRGSPRHLLLRSPRQAARPWRFRWSCRALRPTPCRAWRRGTREGRGRGSS